MRVTRKIVVGFTVLMLVAVLVLANQLSVINELQSVNTDLSEIDIHASLRSLELWQVADTITANSKKYFVVYDDESRVFYDRLLAGNRKQFAGGLSQLQTTAVSERERVETEKLRAAFDAYLKTFDELKNNNESFGSDNPPLQLTIVLDRLQAQTEVAHDAVDLSIKDQAAQASALGRRAVRLSWMAGIFALVLGGVVAGLIVRSISDPLRRLTNGTRALAKGQFWHRLPADGSDEFADLARDFNVMSERLGELDQMKKDFVSHVSHDLKAPLASMRQVMHLMLQEIPGPLNEQQKSLLRLSYNSAERLAAMVGNLLDVSRMEAGSMEYEMAAHDIIPIINSLMDEFDIQAREKGITLRLESSGDSVFAECDRNRIVQVIGNLYENALKFSPANSTIVTRVEMQPENKIRISVSDCGPGVPEGHKEKIFRKFHQMKHSKKIAGQGVGLGLAICKSIVEAHGGPIWVEDAPAGGSVFSFILPAAASEEVLKCGQSA